VGYELAAALVARGHEVVGIATRAARLVAAHECPEAGFPAGARVFSDEDYGSPLMSSSFLFDALVVAPCSLKSLAGIATGLSSGLVVRAAQIALRTGRRLIVAPRETPLPASALRQMLALRQEGVIIAPLMMAYYCRPRDVGEITAFFVGKLLDLLGIPNELYRRWAGSAHPGPSTPEPGEAAGGSES